MASHLGISYEAVRKNVKLLRALGLITHEGSTKSGHWIILKHIKPKNNLFD